MFGPLGVMGEVGYRFTLMWELAARYSYLTLNDHNIHGGRLVDLTLGVNWYLNPNLRVMWNYVWADASHRFRDGGESNAFQWRIQLAF